MTARHRQPNRWWRLGLVGVLAMLLTGCDLLPRGLSVPDSDPPIVATEVVIDIGESRASLLARLGEPSERQEWLKQGEVIFGPIETFWADVPLGATVEIWRFPSEGGALEAYFVNGSDVVQGSAFAPDGVVY